MMVKNRCGRKLNGINPITTIAVTNAAEFLTHFKCHAHKNTSCEPLTWKFIIFSYKARVKKKGHKISRAAGFYTVISMQLAAKCHPSGAYNFDPYPTAFPYGNGTVLHFYQQQESSTTKTVHKVINKGLKAYV